MAFLLIRDHIDWENFLDYRLLWVMLLFYVGTTIFATVTAYRLKFHLYQLPVSRNAVSTFLGCLFFWSYYFAYFIRNRDLVTMGNCVAKQGNFARHNNGSGWAVLWSVGWFFASAVCIPSMMISPMRANENAAVAMLETYAGAQNEFRSKGYAAIAGNSSYKTGYCDTLSRLYYGKDEQGTPLALIPQKMADSYANQTQGALRMATHGRYRYMQDPYVENHKLWPSQFGLVAIPKGPKRSGHNMFWIGTDGKVLKRFDEIEPERFTEEESPFHPEGRELWIER